MKLRDLACGLLENMHVDYYKEIDKICENEKANEKTKENIKEDLSPNGNIAKTSKV